MSTTKGSEKVNKRSFERKVERLAKACLFDIATGVWAPGDRLPSTREGAVRWSVSPLTVLRAYQRLVAMGVVCSSKRSGYFVESGDSINSLCAVGPELELLYQPMLRAIGRKTKLQPLGVLRGLAAKCEEELRLAPNCAFVECTQYQADRHAAEIEERLRLPCLGLTTFDLKKTSPLPITVRTLITTGFHTRSVRAAGKSAQLDVVVVTVEQDPEFTKQLPRHVSEIRVIGLDEDQAAMVKRDLTEANGVLRVESEVSTPQSIDREIASSFDNHRKSGLPKKAVVLSTSLWSAAGEEWKAHPCVFPYPYRIAESAWPQLAAGIGMPLSLG